VAGDEALVSAYERYVEPGQPGPAVTAVPNSGYRFVKWSDNFADTARTDTINAAAIFSAEFAPVTFSVSYAAGNGGSLMIDGADATVLIYTAQIAAGQKTPFVTAIPDHGYDFVAWSDNANNQVRTDEINGPLTVAALFSPKPQVPNAAASPAREIPTAPTAEVSVVTPVTVIAGTLTAGPNPAATEVKFFITGRTIKTGKLSIYDASGNKVTTIKLNDKGTNGKRTAGTWNVKDNKGRQLPTGSYAVKGTITTKEGTKEKVSTIIAVAK
jgi:hypothetical protein